MGPCQKIIFYSSLNILSNFLENGILRNFQRGLEKKVFCVYEQFKIKTRVSKKINSFRNQQILKIFRGKTFVTVEWDWANQTPMNTNDFLKLSQMSILVALKKQATFKYRSGTILTTIDYKQAQQARVLHYNTLERLASDDQPTGPFVICIENEVL